MKERTENPTPIKNNNEFSEVLKIIAIIISIITVICLITKELLFGNFGVSYSNFILGIFGFSSYVFSTALPVCLVLSMFNKNKISNKLMVLSIFFMLFSALIALEVYTASGSVILTKQLSFNDFINRAFNLEGIGIDGATSGGVVMSSVIYYLVKLLNITGSYVVSGSIFVLSVVALYASIRNMIEKSVSSQNTNNYAPQPNVDVNSQNMTKIRFGTTVEELGHNKSNFAHGNLFNRNETVEQEISQEKPFDARSILYGGSEELPFEEEGFLTNKPSKLNVLNVESSKLSQKTKREIRQEEREKESARNILFGGEELSSSTGFVVDEKNRTDNLSLKTKPNENEEIIQRKPTASSILFGKNDNLEDYVDFSTDTPNAIVPNIIPNNENPFENVKDKKERDILSILDEKLEEKYVSNHNIEEEVAEEITLKVDAKTQKENIKKQLDEVAEQFTITPPTNPVVILKSTKDLKKINGENIEETELLQVKTLNDSENGGILSMSSLKKSDPVIIPSSDDSLIGNDLVVPSQKFYTKEEYIANTKDIISEIKSKDFSNIKMDLPPSLSEEDILKNFDKKYDPNQNQAEIIRNIDQIRSVDEENKPNNSFLTNAVLSSSIDEAFDNLELESPVVVYENSEREIKRDKDNNVLLFQNSSNENSSLQQVSYPLQKPKEVKNVGVNSAYQLPIYAKETIKTEEKVRDYIFPPIELLDKAKLSNFSEEIKIETEKKARALEEIMKSFSINAKVVETVIGPVVTRYECEIQQGTAVKRVEQISKDITMGLESPSEVFILAPIPGKNRVGVEVPNKVRDLVTMRELIESNVLKKYSKTAFVLGNDVSGNNIACDIYDMPHVLIAGSTGMGKSVCLNTLLISVLYNATPEEVRVILVDPKRVEFSLYQNMPHLLIDEIIYDADKVISALNWAIEEMGRRFDTFKSLKTKSLIEYNAKVEKSRQLPRILIIIDELADLLSTNKKEIEDRIQRLSQLARAAGIHLVLATQRPSVDVITGIIKANLPARISFKLSNGVDSKTVLDETGAEKLLGKGDMFYKPPGISGKIRVQGCFVSTEEVERIVDFVIENNPSVYDDNVKTAIFAKKNESNDGDDDGSDANIDDKFIKALRYSFERGQISISQIQRDCSVGYARAGRMIALMEKMGYISGYNGSKARDIYITREEFEEKFGEY